jgi:hypothetical protein
MTDPIREGQRVPRGEAPQGIDRWARHGVEELAERDAQERAEMGQPTPDAQPAPAAGEDGREAEPV